MILTDIQSAIRDTVRDLVQARIKPHSAAFKTQQGYPQGLFEELAALGLMGMTAPEAFGGAGADYVSYALSLVEVATADGALSTIVSIPNSLIVSGLIKDGTAERQARFLPDLISGRMIGAFALTEADAGSDASAIRTRARKVDGGYRLNGSKRFITAGRIAGIAMVYALTDPAAGKCGISGFIVPTDSPGYSIDKVEHKLGQAVSDTCAVPLRRHVRRSGTAARRGGRGLWHRALEPGSGADRHRRAVHRDGAGRARHRHRLCQGPQEFRGADHPASGGGLSLGRSGGAAGGGAAPHAPRRKPEGCRRAVPQGSPDGQARRIGDCGNSGFRCAPDAWRLWRSRRYGVAKIYRNVRVCQIYEGTSDIQRMNGGATALGHPIGASGARILVSLLAALEARGLKCGVASLCIGGGEATAVAIELN